MKGFYFLSQGDFGSRLLVDQGRPSFLFDSLRYCHQQVTAEWYLYPVEEGEGLSRRFE